MSDTEAFATWFRAMQGELSDATTPAPQPTETGLTDRLFALRDAIVGHTPPKPTPLKDLVPWILELCEDGASLGEIAAEVGLSHGSVIPRIMYGTSRGGVLAAYPIATPEQRARYRALVLQRSPVPKGKGRRRFRNRLRVLLNQPDIDFRAELAGLLEWAQGNTEAALAVRLGCPPRKSGQKAGALHSRSIPVTTPRGPFVSVAAASEAFGVSRQGGLHRLRRGDWQVAGSGAAPRRDVLG